VILQKPFLIGVVENKDDHLYPYPGKTPFFSPFVLVQGQNKKPQQTTKNSKIPQK
jgi:hypothetical protein